MPKRKQRSFENITDAVGSFYQELACHLFRGKQLGYRDDRGDVYLGALDVWGEAKGASNSKPWRLRTDQVERYAEQQSDRLYLLFGYKNAIKVDGKRVKPLAYLTDEELPIFLPYYTGILYVLDISVILALWKEYGDRTERFRGNAHRQDRVLELTRTQLAGFSEAKARATLRALGLTRTQYVVRDEYVQTRYKGNEYYFRIRAVILPHLALRFDEALAAAKRPIKRVHPGDRQLPRLPLLSFMAPR